MAKLFIYLLIGTSALWLVLGLFSLLIFGEADLLTLWLVLTIAGLVTAWALNTKKL